MKWESENEEEESLERFSVEIIAFFQKGKEIFFVYEEKVIIDKRQNDKAKR